MPLEQLWADFNTPHFFIATLAIWLALGAFQRIRLRGSNRNLLFADLSAAAAMIVSLPPIYKVIDPILGGVNLANFLIHFLASITCWIATFALTETTQKALGHNDRLRWYMNPLVPAIATVLLFLVFAPMGFTTPSIPGMNGYDPTGSILFSFYQVLTIFGLLCGAYPLMPQLWRLMNRSKKASYKLQLFLYEACYALALVVLVCSIIGPFYERVSYVREYSLILSCFALACALMVSAQQGKSRRRSTLNHPQKSDR